MAALRDDAIDVEISLLDGVLDVDAGAHRAPYPALRADDFELLLYALCKEKQKPDSFYDTVTLMITGADRGRDVWLTCGERPVGLVQCKRTAPGFTAPAAIREVIKFLLFAEGDHALLPDPSSFRYALALGSDPAGTTVALFTSPKQWQSSNDGKIDGALSEQISGPVTVRR